MRKKLAVLSLFLFGLTGSAYGYPKECSLEADKYVLTLIDLNRKLALKVRKNKKEIASLKKQVSLLQKQNRELMERVKSLEILVDGLISQSKTENASVKSSQSKEGASVREATREPQRETAKRETVANVRESVGKREKNGNYAENIENNAKIYQLATFTRLNPYTTREIWQLVEELNSQGIETKVALTTKGYLVLFGKVPKGLEGKLRVIFPDMFVPQKIRNPHEFFRELPVFASYDDFMTYLTQNLSRDR